jgi:hypothetical protein
VNGFKTLLVEIEQVTPAFRNGSAGTTPRGTCRNLLLRRTRSRAFRRAGGSLPALAGSRSKLPGRALRRTRDGQSVPDPPTYGSRLSESTRRRRPCYANRVRRDGRAALRGRGLLGDRPGCRRLSSLLGKFAWGNSHLTLWQATILNRGGFTASSMLIYNPSIVERTSSFPDYAFTMFKKCPQITM